MRRATRRGGCSDLPPKLLIAECAGVCMYVWRTCASFGVRPSPGERGGRVSASSEARVLPTVPFGHSFTYLFSDRHCENEVLRSSHIADAPKTAQVTVISPSRPSCHPAHRARSTGKARSALNKPQMGKELSRLQPCYRVDSLGLVSHGATRYCSARSGWLSSSCRIYHT